MVAKRVTIHEITESHMQYGGGVVYGPNLHYENKMQYENETLVKKKKPCISLIVQRAKRALKFFLYIYIKKNTSKYVFFM